MNYHDIITTEPGKRGGKPCLRGLDFRHLDAILKAVITLFASAFVAVGFNWFVLHLCG